MLRLDGGWERWETRRGKVVEIDGGDMIGCRLA
jgi:hypothetical protein